MGAKAVAVAGLIVLGALVVGVLGSTSGSRPSFEMTENRLTDAVAAHQTESTRAGRTGAEAAPAGAGTRSPAGAIPEPLWILRKRAEWLERRNSRLWAEVRELEEKNESLRLRVEHLEGLLEARPRPVGIYGSLISTPPIETTVHSVDRRRRIVILPVGRETKVSRGMCFHLSRDGSYVGEVKVTEVRLGQCTARFVLIKPGMRIRIGDMAATRL